MEELEEIHDKSPLILIALVVSSYMQKSLRESFITIRSSLLKVKYFEKP